VDETFDPLSEDYLEDPYPYYVRFRREAPVFFAPKINMWVISRYEDILNIVKDPGPSRTPRCRSPSSRWSPTSCGWYPQSYQHLPPQA
jgi:cytochrome P450